MKRVLVFFAVLMLTVGTIKATDCPSGKQCNARITAVATSCASDDAVVLQLTERTGSATITLLGTFVGKVEFEQSADNEGSWVAITGMPQPSGAGVTGATGTGTWRFGVGGSTQLCVRASLYTSGPIEVIMNQSPASASTGAQGCDGVIMGGDLSGTCPNPTVAQVNGGVVPASAALLGSTASRQLVAAATVTAANGGTGAVNTATSGRYLKGNGANFVTSSGAASGTGSCTNQFVTATNSDAAPTCTSATLASAQFANQGTTTTVLHGNGAGNPAFGAVAVADVAAILKTRQLGFMVGQDNGAVLADTDDQADIYINRLGQGITLTEVFCICDGGTPRIQLVNDDGTPVNILTDNAGAGMDCSTAGAPGTLDGTEEHVADGSKIDFTMVTAGGVAKRVTVYAKYTLD